VKQSLRSLIRHLIDYAGLFPPAGLPMTDAVRNYAAYREGDDSFALGRFIVPISRLDEFNIEATEYLAEASRPWRLSALAGSDVRADAAILTRYHAGFAQGVDVDTVEVKASSEAEILNASSAFPDLTIYFEIPVNRPDLFPLIVSEGHRTKIRTGGITPQAFPQADTITRFIANCYEGGAMFKATAGLHHPLRCDRPLTYEADAPVGTMHGFINVFLAATAIPFGMEVERATELLMETDASAFRFEDEAVYWRDAVMSTEEISEVRDRFAISFGSCSFEEPLGDLRELGWI
jgi:hypothetical protein